MKTTALIAATALAGFAGVPATAIAHPGNGKGHGQREARAPGKAGGRCARPQRVAFVARGTFVSFGQDGLVMKVVRANHHARAYTSGTPLSIEGAKVTFRGLKGFDEAVSTDRVMVIGKLVRPKRGCSGDTSVVLRRVTVRREAAEPVPQQD
jgi:hypothetical protein